jgi:hypothetical protein
MIFGLACTEKTMMVVPLVFGVTACFLVKGSPGRAIWRALTRFWATWLVLIALSIPFFWLYLQHAQQAVRQPASVDQVTTFFETLLGKTLIPGLLGGPWTWLEGTTVPLATPAPFLHAMSLVIAGLFIAFTIWRRPAATRAWIVLLGYAVIATGLVASSRMGAAAWSWLAGMVTRYTSDIVVVAALCIGVAMFGLRDLPDRRAPRRIPWVQTTRQGRIAWIAAGSAFALLLAFGTVVTTSRYSTAWSIQPGRDFFQTAKAELAAAPAGSVFFDRPLADPVMSRLAWPRNSQSTFFKVLGNKGPVFVKGAEFPKVFTDIGTIKPAFVTPIRETVEGPGKDKCYEVKGGQSVTMQLNGPMIQWGWFFRISYLSDGETPVKVTFGSGSHEFTALEKMHNYYFFLEGGGQSIQVSVSKPGVSMCITQITAGELVPWLL